MATHLAEVPVGSPLLYTWTVPNTNRRFTARRDAFGFVLMHFVMFYNAEVERLDIPKVNEPVDEGAYNHRFIAGTKRWSLHASGRAVDLNWNRHPQNTPARHTFTRKQIDAIHTRMKWMNRIAMEKKAIEWGGDWPSWSGSTAKTDSMHTQVNAVGDAAIRRLALALSKTPRGRAIIKANPQNRDYLKVL